MTLTLQLPKQPAAYVNNPAYTLDNNYFNNLVQQVAFAGGCYNCKGERVPCRKTF
jgi:hypothetical protein